MPKNQFKSTFGSAYLNSKKMELKLAKQVKKEPGKESFPWDLGLLLVQPMKYALISIFIFYNRKNKSNSCKRQCFFKFPCKKDDFPRARSRMLYETF